eukprot:m.80505 g.80505  ORF g.80505 m.80505 type:complete len:125 (-) comp12605_c0_seq1:3460-3834(-)
MRRRYCTGYTTATRTARGMVRGYLPCTTQMYLNLDVMVSFQKKFPSLMHGVSCHLLVWVMISSSPHTSFPQIFVQPVAALYSDKVADPAYSTSTAEWVTNLCTCTDAAVERTAPMATISHTTSQ